MRHDLSVQTPGQTDQDAIQDEPLRFRASISWYGERIAARSFMTPQPLLQAHRSHLPFGAASALIVLDRQIRLILALQAFAKLKVQPRESIPQPTAGGVGVMGGLADGHGGFARLQASPALVEPIEMLELLAALECARASVERHVLVADRAEV